MPAVRNLEHHYRMTQAGQHGLNRRPTRADRQPLNLELIAEYNRGVARAVMANRRRPQFDLARDRGWR